MANTYTQMYVQIIFAVLGRANVIREIHRNIIKKEHSEKNICLFLKRMKLNMMKDIYLNGMINDVAATLLQVFLNISCYKDIATTLQPCSFITNVL